MLKHICHCMHWCFFLKKRYKTMQLLNVPLRLRAAPPHACSLFRCCLEYFCMEVIQTFGPSLQSSALRIAAVFYHHLLFLKQQTVLRSEEWVGSLLRCICNLKNPVRSWEALLLLSTSYICNRNKISLETALYFFDASPCHFQLMKLCGEASGLLHVLRVSFPSE